MIKLLYENSKMLKKFLLIKLNTLIVFHQLTLYNGMQNTLTAHKRSCKLRSRKRFLFSPSPLNLKITIKKSLKIIGFRFSLMGVEKPLAEVSLRLLFRILSIIRF